MGTVEPRRWPLALAVLAGALWFLSCADFNVWPLAWFAMVPVLFVVERAGTTRRAFFLAWIAGVVANGGGFYWIAGLLVRFGHVPRIVSLLLFAVLAGYQGLVFGVFGAVTRVIRRRTAWPMAVVAPVVIVTFELAMPMVFPFSVAITQAWQPHVIQVADLAGMPAVAALLLMINGAIYDVVLVRPRRVGPAVASAAVLGLALAYGHWRIATFDHLRAAAPQMDVGVVQPNVSFDMKGPNRAAVAERQRIDLQEQSHQLEAEGAELLVWPESAFPYVIGHSARVDLDTGNGQRVRARFSVPVLFGAVSVEGAPGAPVRLWNSAFLLDRDGTFAGRYDKMHLMVLSERQYERGRAVTTLDVRTADGHVWKVGPLICYEDILDGAGRRLAALHPNVLVNLTNDAWFGDTSEPWEHLALSVFTAIETRTDLVRAVNTGVSAFVDASGHVYAKTYAVNPVAHPMGADRLHARVAMLDGGHTVYAAVGNVFAYLCATVTVFLLLVKPRR